MPSDQSDQENTADLRIVEIQEEPVELYKILKFEGLVESGGQAKAVIGAGQVRVNGKTEKRKRKKIVAGDLIEFRNEKFGIELALSANNQDVQAIDEEGNETPAAGMAPLAANDCLRSICDMLDLDEKGVVKIFGQVRQNLDESQVASWLKKVDESGYETCSDKLFLAFLDGLIVHRRGRKEDAPSRPEDCLNNNVIFRKLKIAFNLHAEDLVELLSLANLSISKQELSAFFRRPDHKRYRACDSQVLGGFLAGLQARYTDVSAPAGGDSPG